MRICRTALLMVLSGGVLAFGCSDSSSPGAGGTAGSGGSGGGGTAGSGGSGGGGGIAACQTSPPEPPELADACATNPPILVNPLDCDTDGVEPVTHRLTLLRVERSQDVGFDLDGVNTIKTGSADMPVFEDASCNQGPSSAGDGAKGVDNQLAALEPIFAMGGGSFDDLDNALANAVCQDPMGTFDLLLAIAVSEVDGANCANASITVNGFQVPGLQVLNFVDGCLSGSLGDQLLFLPGLDTPVTFNNSSLAVSLDQTGGFRGILASTASGEDAAALADAIAPGSSAAVSQTFDILETLGVDPNADCDSISQVLQVGGVVVTGAGGAGGGSTM